MVLINGVEYKLQTSPMPPEYKSKLKDVHNKILLGKLIEDTEFSVYKHDYLNRMKQLKQIYE